VSFARYGAYKDSDIDWIGPIPAHWDVDRIKRSVLSCRNGIWGAEPAGTADDIPCVRVADFDRERLVVDQPVPTIRNVSPSERQGRVLSAGDLLLEKSGGGELQPVGCVVLYRLADPAVCSNFVARMQLAPQMASSFWRYLHAAAYAAGLNTRSVKQTSGIQNLDQQAYLDERVPFPPYDEQVMIADFIDSQTAKIDALVAEQQHLIELLNEKRQAVISHAVTKGLNTDAPMKTSNVEWLGSVPAHWEVGGLTKYFESLVDYRGRTPTKVADGVLLLTARNIRNGRIDYDASAEFILKDEYEAAMSRGKPEIGDVLFTTEAPLGQVANMDRTDVALAQRIIKFRGRKGVLSNEYLKYWLLGHFAQAEMRRLATGSTALGIKGSKVGQLRVAVPPFDEQLAITRFLDQECNQTDALQRQAGHAIELLEERRTALISAAVTGQIDVRGHATAEVA